MNIYHIGPADGAVSLHMLKLEIYGATYVCIMHVKIWVLL